MLVSRKIKEEESEVDGINNACRIINEIMNAWMDRHVVDNIVNESEEIMNRDKN